MGKKYEQNLWGGRFTKDTDELMKSFNENFSTTLWLLDTDIQASIAHASMLGKSKIISSDDMTKLLSGLKSLQDDLAIGELDLSGEYEDIHSFVELTLHKRIGDVAKKLHTARSRNDQVNTDMLIYTKKQLKVLYKLMEKLIDTLAKKAEENPYIMPGYTHLQKAQIITFKHYLNAYKAMFKRDSNRIHNLVNSLNSSPLGACALAGTTHDTLPEVTAGLLGFDKPYDNFLDAVSDRDYILDSLYIFSMIMMHLSRLSEELIIFSTDEFKFVTFDDAYSTGSSIMPQKKNPDSAELVRGKSAVVMGNLSAMFTLMKALPLAYNKDMQEDKEIFYSSMDITFSCIKIMTGVIDTLIVNKENMFKDAQKGFLNATEVADYLVKKGVAFRDSHKIVGEMVLYCERNNKLIEELTYEELSQFGDYFDEDFAKKIDVKNILSLGIKNKML